MIRALGRRVLGDIVEIGRRLIDAKKLVGHGGWLTWLEREFRWSEDTAERYMRLADDKFRNLRNADIPISALYLLAKPGTPPEAIKQIAARSESGEKVRLVTVQKVIAEAKAPQQVRVHIVRQTPAPPDIIYPVFAPDNVEPDPVDPPRRSLTIDEARLELERDNRLEAKRLINDLEMFGFAADRDKLEAIRREAALAQVIRDDTTPIRLVVEAILAGLDHPKDHGGDIFISLDPPKRLAKPQASQPNRLGQTGGPMNACLPPRIARAL